MLISCGDGIATDEAKVFINDFLTAVSAEDYAKAEEFLHPDRPAELEPFINECEEQKGIDFSSGVSIERYTGFNYSYYDSTVDGSSYELTMKAKVGDKSVSITVEIVQNDNGYGIYNFYID